MDKFWEIISRWDRAGQGIFFFLVLSAIYYFSCYALKHFVVLVHGWPPSHYEDEEHDT